MFIDYITDDLHHTNILFGRIESTMIATCKSVINPFLPRIILRWKTVWVSHDLKYNPKECQKYFFWFSLIIESGKIHTYKNERTG